MHENAALLFYVRGSAVVEQRERFTVQAGDIHLVPAGEPHRVTSSADRAAWGIGFCASCYAPTELSSLLDPFERARAGAAAVVNIAPSRRTYLASLFAELQFETTRTDGRSELVERSLLALVLSEISRAIKVTTESHPQSSLVSDALRFIERNCLGDISLGDVAAAVHRSPSHVTTALKQATGKSVGEWILAGRMSEARNRLLHSDELVDVIAERVGYGDTTHFIRLFRRSHGVTPAAWRAKQRHTPLKTKRTPSSRRG